MRRNVLYPLFVSVLVVVSISEAQSRKGVSMVKKLTPVLFVDRIEPCVDFWVNRLGFQKTVEVPDGDRLGFVILNAEGVELMYQTTASLSKDQPQVAAASPRTASYLYMGVPSLEAVEKALKGIDYVVPKRTTFYGATEIVVRDPAGNFVCFAQPAAQPKGSSQP
jgi:uncharacterized glyoxalase superfamily protein PhnB